MRHRRKVKKFSRSRAQRKALVVSLLRAVIIKERISTTESKAKALREWVDKLINWAKTDTLHHRRLSFRLLKDHNLVKRLFEVIGPRFKDVQGGYTRVIDFRFRKGDNAKISIFELTKREEKKTKHKEKLNQETTPEKESLSEKTEKSKKSLISGMKSILKKKNKST